MRTQTGMCWWIYSQDMKRTLMNHPEFILTNYNSLCHCPIPALPTHTHTHTQREGGGKQLD